MKIAVPLALALSVGVLSWPATAAEAFPYRATIADEWAEAHSGPGDAFYATQRLPRGTEVEVYRHETDGWCAIRPPDGSFSWIPVEAVQIVEDGRKVRVIRDDAFTYVGTDFSDAHHVEYIPLEPAETLVLLGSRILPEADVKTEHEWVKVAPPDGEFRWIHRRHLNEPSARQPVDHRTTPAAPVASAIDRDLGVAVAGWNAPHGAPEPTGTANLDTQAVHVAPAVESEPPADDEQHLVDAEQWRPRTRATTKGITIENAEPPASGAADDIAGTKPETLLPIPAQAELPDQLRDLDLQLSTIVAQGVEQWDLAGLQSEVQALDAQIGDDRQLRQLLDGLRQRIAQFERVRQRYVKLAAQAEPQPPADLPAAKSSPAVPRILPSVKAAPIPIADRTHSGSTFDARGWLMPVFTSRMDVPEFALTDDRGQILQFVSADEQLNLRRYLRKEVGIYGTRGFLPAYQKPHLTATEVVVLSEDE